MTSRLEKGDTVPLVQLPITGGGQINLSTADKRYLVVFFYPKDNTKGCTTEAKDFTALKSDFETAQVDIVGVSKDSLSSHEKFISKQDLNLPLASDEDGLACEAFGVWVEKSMYGKTYMGIERSTFLIGSDGKIIEAWRKVRVKDHAAKVLETINSLDG